MKKFWKTILAIGGAIAGILAIFAATKQSQSKKEFKKKVKANNDKINEVKKKTAVVEKQKAETKKKIKETSSKIKSTKSKVKSTKNAKSTISDFKNKYRKK
jgi:septal ring factor EnvC (AmiA/AmiB activator)